MQFKKSFKTPNHFFAVTITSCKIFREIQIVKWNFQIFALLRTKELLASICPTCPSGDSTVLKGPFFAGYKANINQNSLFLAIILYIDICIVYEKCGKSTLGAWKAKITLDFLFFKVMWDILNGWLLIKFLFT